MKQKITYLTAMLCLTALVMSAQPQPKQPQRACDVLISNNKVHHYHGASNIHKMDTGNQNNLTEFMSYKQLHSEVMDSVVINVEFKADNENFQVSEIRAFSDTYFARIGVTHNLQSGWFKIPKGTYDFVCNGWLPIQEFGVCSLKNFLFALELVAVQNDTTIVIDFTKCTNDFNHELQKVNGELMEYTVIGEYGPNLLDPETIVQGNVLWEEGDRTIELENFGAIESFYTSHGEMQTFPVPIMVNSLSDRYTFSENYILACNDGRFYTFALREKGTENFPLKASKDDYTIYEEKIINTQIGSQMQDWPNGITWYQGRTNNPVARISMTVWDDNGTELEKIEIPNCFYLPSDDYGNIQIAIHSSPSVNRSISVGIKPCDYNISNFSTIDNSYPMYKFDADGQPMYIVDCREAIDIYTSEIGVLKNKYVARERFSYLTHQKLGHFINSCPINALTFYNNPYAESKEISLSLNPYGRFGELINTDSYFTELSIIYNGNKIYDGRLNEWIPNNQEQGIYEMTFINHNVSVDSIAGENITKVFFDQNQDDWFSPVLKMLQFRDSENNVTDRFDTPDGGVIMFAGGDLDPRSITFMTEDGYEAYWDYYECQPMTVEVSYAPYGSDEWQPLEGVEHQEEYDDIPGMGFFYQGSLASVNRESENGWFDLKFRLEDEAGNWQEQTLSPAFRIDNLVQSTVTEVRDGSAHEVARYSIDGKRVDDSHHGIVIVKMSDGTARKVLVP